MLMLTRLAGQSILIAQQITLKVICVSPRDDAVDLSLQAPFPCVFLARTQVPEGQAFPLAQSVWRGRWRCGEDIVLVSASLSFCLTVARVSFRQNAQREQVAQVQLGFQAERSISILRAELVEASRVPFSETARISVLPCPARRKQHENRLPGLHGLPQPVGQGWLAS